MKKDEPKRGKMLPTVTIKAKVQTPKKVFTDSVRLTPTGKAAKRTVDSLRKLPGGGRAIGEPMKGTNRYGAEASDNIKKLIKKK